MTVWVPGAGSRDPLSDRSGALFSLDASEFTRRLALSARSGQAATFTRAGAAYVRDAAGRLVPVVHSQPRIEGVLNGSLTEACLLLERAATNGLTAPEDMSDAGWTKTNLTVSANAVAAPVAARSVTADSLLETTTNGQHTITQSVTSITAGAVQSRVLHLKANGRTRVEWYLTAGADIAGITVDLSAGTVSNFVSGSGTVTHKLIRTLADGWVEVEVAGVVNGSATSATETLRLHNGSTNSYAGDTTKGVYVWGWMVEKNTAWPSSYTDGSRIVDVLTYPYLSLPQAQTIYWRGVLRDTSGTYGLVNIGGGATPSDPRLALYVSGSTINLIHDTGASDVVANVSHGASPGDWIEARGVLLATGAVKVGVSRNGGAETVHNPGTALALAAAWASATIEVGRIGNAASFTGITAHRRVWVGAGDRTLQECREAW